MRRQTIKTKINDQKQKHLVIFQPEGLGAHIEEGKTVKEASQKLGVDLQSICGGLALCGKCKVRIMEGFFNEYGIDSQREHLSPMEETEKRFFAKHPELGEYRLACATRIYGDIVVFVPEESRASRHLAPKSIMERGIDLRPAVRKYYVEVTPPTSANPLGDWERVQLELNRRFGLSNLTIDYHMLVSLQKIIRQANWRISVSVWMDKEVIKIEPGLVETGYGLAVDIGTTTLAGYLCNLDSGEVVGTDSIMNPQVTYGEDVMSRITYAVANKDGLQTMNQAIIKGINQVIGQVCLQAGIKRQDILDMTIVGNTCMHHLFLGINPEYLGRSPFSPSVHSSLDIKAGDLGLKISSGAYVYVLPIEAGFVGADNVGVLIAEEPHNQDEIVLIIDIGTNGELVLGNREKLICSSCATGPAFEGANIKFGMRAAPGAIERVEIDPDSKGVHFEVISRTDLNKDSEAIKPKGICGSGVIDAIAQMFMAGILQSSGRFNINLPTPRLRITEQGPEFVIAWAAETSIDQDISITQADVRAVQLAKAAMYAGAKLMMHHRGVKRLDKVILAGAFGSYIDKKSAMLIGLFPDCAVENVYAVGNAAGDGARIALLNIDQRQEADKVARQVEYIELAMDPDFNREFTQAMHFPHMKDTFAFGKTL